jgi:hypothetical protein
MAALSQDRAGIVRALIEAAPDSAIRSLEMALGADAGGASLSQVKSIVDTEVHDRTVRDTVFDPLTPLFAPRADGMDQLYFPRAALGRLWRALKAARPRECAIAASAPQRRTDGEPLPPIFDELCEIAASHMRAKDGEFAALAEMLNGFRPGADEEFAVLLKLSPVAREALRLAPSWMARMTDERQAAARLIYKDAVALSDDAGPRLIEIIFARLSEPWTILRVMSAVMLKPDDRYAAGSELASFGERLLREVDRRLEVIKAFDYDGGVVAGDEAASNVRIVAAIAAEFEHTLTMTRDGPWGQRLGKQKQVMAATAEGHLHKLDKAVSAALPMQPVRIGGRTVHGEPRLDTPPDPAAVARAKALLTFFIGARLTAVQGGFGTVRAKVGEEVAHTLDAYVEQLLATLRSGEKDYIDNAGLYLEVAADLSALVHDDQTAQIIRRRAAAA